MPNRSAAKVIWRRIASLLPAIPLVWMVTGCSDNSTDSNAVKKGELAYLEIFDPSTNLWAPGADMPDELSESVSVVFNGKLYVFGGLDYYAKDIKDEDLFADVYIYDPSTDTWTTGTSVPTKRYGAAADVIDGKLYMAGGEDHIGVVDVLEVYDFATDSWDTSKEPMLTGRKWAVAGAIDGKLYVAGGYTTSDVNILEVYDPATDSWESLNSMSWSRGQAAGGVIDGKLYVAGGYLPSEVQTDKLEVFDPAANAWTTMSEMEIARGEAAYGVISGKLYVVGGEISSGAKTAVLEVYDPTADTWTILPSMQYNRAEATAGVISGKLYVVGGYR